MMTKKYATAVLFSFLITLSFQAQALKTVAKSGGDYNTIAVALAAAGSGEEVRITDQGVYAEAVTLNGRQLTAVPAGAKITGSTLTIAGTAPVLVRGITFEPAGAKAITISGASSEVQIQNVTVTGGNQSINIPGAATVSITSSTISDDAGAAIVLLGTNGPANLTVSNSFIARSKNHGIRIGRKSTVTLVDSTITSSVTGNAILLNTQTGATADDTALTIRNSRLIGNSDEAVRSVVKLGSLTVENSIIRGNSEGFYFGTSGGNTVSVDRSDISANRGNGFALNTSGVYTIANSTITSNTNNGIRRDQGDTDLGDRTITISGNTISGNGKNGVILRSTSSAKITALVSGNTISGNRWRAIATESSVALNTVLLTAERNLLRDGSGNTTPTVALAWTAPGSRLVNNLVEQGRYGVTISQSAVDVYHNTLAGSDGTTGTAVAINDGGSQPIRLINNILERSSFGVVVNGSAPTQLALDYNLINAKTQALNLAAAALAGTRNILGQPAGFIAPSSILGAGNYHLAQNSPAIDAGDSAPGVTLDLENRRRPSGLKPDLGAYEFPSTISAASPAWLLY